MLAPVFHALGRMQTGNNPKRTVKTTCQGLAIQVRADDHKWHAGSPLQECEHVTDAVHAHGPSMLVPPVGEPTSGPAVLGSCGMAFDPVAARGSNSSYVVKVFQESFVRHAGAPHCAVDHMLSCRPLADLYWPSGGRNRNVAVVTLWWPSHERPWKAPRNLLREHGR
jgi:hypothetical protein